MAVTTTNTIVSYSGNGSTANFSISFQFFASTDITMTVTDDTLSDVTASYAVTVTGGTDSDGLPATGTASVNPAPASGTTIEFRRFTSKLQSSVFDEGTSFPAKTVEAIADRVTLLVQEANYASSLVSFDPSGDWATSTPYTEGDLVRSNNGSYIALSDHTSSASDEPGVGASWTTYWSLFAADGPAAFNWQGTWAQSTAYSVDDAVYNDGSSYICTAAHTSSASDEPGTGGSWQSYWDVFASQGGSGSGSGDLLAANNLSELTATAATARSNIDAAQASHNHSASDINSGTLTHERGGLEADVSAYNGTLRISGGATSALSTVSQAEAEAGSSTTVREWTAQRVNQAITALASQGESWSRKTGGYTASASDALLCDTVAVGAFTVTLPASPSEGDTVRFVPSSSWETNNLTIGRNGNTIMGDAADLTCDVTKAFSLVWDGTDNDWRIF